MIALDSGDKIQGYASAATVVDYTLHGIDNNVIKQMEDGQLPSTIGDLYTADSIDAVSSIILVNTDSSARTVNLLILPSAGTARRIIPKDMTLGIGFCLLTDGKSIQVYDASGNLQQTVTIVAHTLGGSSHDADTLSNLNSKISDATLVDTDSIVLKALFDVNTILAATSDNTPAAVAIAASRILGRKSTGNIVALTAAELLTIINVAAGADVTGSNAPQAHKASHQDTGGDEISVTALSGLLADDQHVLDAEAVSAVEAAGLTFDENKTIILDAVLSGDGKWSGITEAGTAGVTMAVGDLVYLAVADGRWELTDADTEATAFGKLGICILAANDGAATNVLLYGKVRSPVFPAFTVGAPVHVGTTAGDVQVAAPSGTTGMIVRIIGYGNTAEDLFFCPDNTYVKLA